MPRFPRLRATSYERRHKVNVRRRVCRRKLVLHACFHSSLAAKLPPSGDPRAQKGSILAEVFLARAERLLHQHSYKCLLLATRGNGAKAVRTESAGDLRTAGGPRGMLRLSGRLDKGCPSSLPSFHPSVKQTMQTGNFLSFPDKKERKKKRNKDLKNTKK